MNKILAALILVAATVCANAQSYSPMNWGISKTSDPYSFGTNINNTWYNLGTISSTGTWALPSSISSFTQSGTGAVATNVDAVLKSQAVTPFQYGATQSQCDGSTDISAAVQAAVNTGKNVYIPRTPNYCVFGDIVLQNANQAVFSENQNIKPKTGADRMFWVKGYNNSLRGFNIADTGGLTRQGTLTSPASIGATSLNVSAPSDGGVWKVGQRVAVRLNSGNYFSAWITNVGISGPYTLTINDALPEASASGSAVWATFGLIHADNAYACTISNMTIVNFWGGINLDTVNPTSPKGVQDCVINNIKLDTGHGIFAVLKGRNANGNTIRDVKGYGGWGVTDTYTGTGAKLNFSLSEYLYLKREISVKVNNVPKTEGVDYTVDTNGLGITFAVAPASGASVVANYWTYGVDGYYEDGRYTTTASGGNIVDGIAMLQFHHCGNIRGGQLTTIANSIFDTCANEALMFDDTTQNNKASNIFAGWAPKSFFATNNAQVIFAASISAVPTPAGYQTNGSYGTAVVLDPGTKVTGDFYSGADGSHNTYSFSILTSQQTYDGKTSMGANCSAPTNSAALCGSLGSLIFNGDDTATFTKSTAYLYAPSHLILQSAGDVSLSGPSETLKFNGVDTLEYSNSIAYLYAPGTLNTQVVTKYDVQVGAVEKLSVFSNIVASQVPFKLKDYTVATLPACNASLYTTMAAVSDANSTTYNSIAAGGGANVMPVFCDGASWRLH